MLVVGGLGNPKGVIIGAAVVGSLLEVIRRVLTSADLPQDIRFLVFSCALIIFIHLRSHGIFPDRPLWLRQNLRPSPKPLLKAERSTSNTVPSDKHVLLEVEDVTKSFDGVVALNGLSFQAKMGECIALIGPNGSGKTTLLNSICGLIRVDQGTIRLLGQRIDTLAPYRIARNGVGRSFQELSVFDDISVEDNIYIVTKQASLKNVDQMLDQFGFTDSTALCETLSYGSKKALDLARLFVEPYKLRLALLDEPTAGLTRREASELVLTLSRLREESKFAMVVVSHDVMFLEALYVDRVAVLHQGRLFKEGSFSAIRNDADVRKLFWGNSEVAT
jgi:ABC-type branched-subunit amino acid transport system ATPase component